MVFQNNLVASHSKKEAAFLESSAIKRNRRYFDIQKIKVLESSSQVRRRRPDSSASSVQEKIDHSFSNSTTAFTERREHEIHKFRARFNSEERTITVDPRPSSRQTHSSKSQNPPNRSIRGVGIAQHLSREQYYQTKSKPTIDERLFNNFHMNEPDSSHTVDLKRGSQRDFDNSLKYINDLEYDSKKVFEDAYYKRTTMDCRFHYKKQKITERQFFKPQREENQAANRSSPSAVRNAFTNATPNSGNIDSFYMNTGRELPCQLDNRVGTSLNSYWRRVDGSIQRPQVEFAVRCMKDKLENERKEGLSASKRPKFRRDELCDRKYFIIHGKS